MRILLIEDDQLIGDGLNIGLGKLGFNVDWFQNGLDGREALLQAPYDAVVLDLGLPGLDGLSILKEWRMQGKKEPVLILTAKGDVDQRIIGLESGADDYLAKPFSYPELVARVKGLLRRYTIYQGKKVPTRKTEYIEFENLRVDCCRNMAWKHGEELNLTSTEYRILRLLLAYPGQIFSAQNIYESVWEEPFYSGDSNSVMVFIRRLREKIEDNPRRPARLVTVWGKGYRIE